uniref:Brain protein I3 n=1 Tax=Angiostrongylus cantonensis TaxID=6313 RepID=A0A0K0DJE8_ANGCA
LASLCIVIQSSLTAFLLILYSYCHYKCGFCRRKHKRAADLPEVRITMHNDAKTPLCFTEPFSPPLHSTSSRAQVHRTETASRNMR